MNKRAAIPPFRNDDLAAKLIKKAKLTIAALNSLTFAASKQENFRPRPC